MRKQIWGAIAIASLGWGTGGVATRVALDEGMEPFGLSAYRTAIAAAAVVAYLVLRGRPLTRDPLVWRVGVVVGLLNLAAPFALFTYAYQYASAGFVGLLAALIPLATAALAHFLLPAERMTLGRVLGLAVALAGVAVLLASGDSGLAAEGRPVLAFLLGIGAVACISLAGIYAKRHAGSYEPADVTTVQFAVGTVLLLVGMGIVEGAPGNQTGLGWLMLVYMGLASTFVPFAVFYWLLRHVSVTYASVIGYVVPLVAVTAGALLLSERLEPGIVIGGALILAGVVITDRLEGRAAQRPPVVPTADGRGGAGTAAGPSPRQRLRRASVPRRTQ